MERSHGILLVRGPEMTTATQNEVEREVAAEYFLFEPADWEFYETVLKQLGDRRVFATFDGESLEIMVPGFDHEYYAKYVARMIEVFTVELNIPLRSARRAWPVRRSSGRGPGRWRGACRLSWGAGRRRR